MRMAVPGSAVELLAAGINALAHADAAQLEALAEAARGAEAPQTVEERKKVREGLRTLGYLIALTRRNLRLLRGSSGDAVFLG
jgi:hypothetical protein